MLGRVVTVGAVDATPSHCAVVDVGSAVPLTFGSSRPPSFQPGDFVVVGRVDDDHRASPEEWTAERGGGTWRLCSSRQLGVHPTSDATHVVRPGFLLRAPRPPIERQQPRRPSAPRHEMLVVPSWAVTA